jgi:hypothetical protein
MSTSSLSFERSSELKTRRSANAKTNALIISAALFAYVSKTIVTGMASVKLSPHVTKFKIQLIVNHNHVIDVDGVEVE